MSVQWVIGNWKMNGGLASNAALLADLVSAMQAAKSSTRMGVCAPAPYWASCAQQLKDTTIDLGAQNVSEHASGAYTGEVAASMLQDFGVQLVIVGHSERRSLYHETDAVVAAKTQAALQAGLTPIVCVGETLAERESEQARAVVLRQLQAVMDGVGVIGLAQCIVAYEPVWANGTGKTASPEQAQEVHAWLRAHVSAQDANVAQNLSIVYGGSVKAANAQEIFGQPDVDGGLIGGASLNAAEFMAIYQAIETA